MQPTNPNLMAPVNQVATIEQPRGINPGDIEEARSLIGRRNALLHFLGPRPSPRFLSIVLPTQFDIEIVKIGENSYSVFIDGPTECELILEHARRAARVNIAEIDQKLVALGVNTESFDAP